MKETARFRIDAFFSIVKKIDMRALGKTNHVSLDDCDDGLVDR